MHILKFFLSDEPPFDQRFRLAKDATLPEINVQVFDEPGLAKDLTGATVTFTMTDVNGVDKIAAVAANLDDATTGSISYDWIAADVDSDAVYEGKFDITVGALKFTVPNGTTQRLIISTGNAEGLALALASTTGFADGGEGRGKNRTLGNTDNFALGIKTNNLVRLHYQADGRIGVNNTSPFAGFDVEDRLDGTVTMRARGAGTVLLEALTYHASQFPNINCRRTRGTLLASTILSDTDVLGEHGWFGHDGVDALTKGASIRATVDGTPTANRMPTKLEILTAEGASDNDIAVAITIAKDKKITLAGELEVDGNLNHDGSNIGFFGTAPAVQSLTYTRNAVAVEDRTLLASASATTLNNNNLLAAIIADLQAYGLLQ